jgi:hypothetical protein
MPFCARLHCRHPPTIAVPADRSRDDFETRRVLTRAVPIGDCEGAADRGDEFASDPLGEDVLSIEGAVPSAEHAAFLGHGPSSRDEICDLRRVALVCGPPTLDWRANSYRTRVTRLVEGTARTLQA